MVMDPAVFCDLTVTSGEYIARYAGGVRVKPAAAVELALHLAHDPDVREGSIRNHTDSRLSDRARMYGDSAPWRGQVTCAVGFDADLHTSCGAVLDALAVLEVILNDDLFGVFGRDFEPIDPTGVNVLVDRELEWPPTESDEALRSVPDADAFARNPGPGLPTAGAKTTNRRRPGRRGTHS